MISLLIPVATSLQTTNSILELCLGDLNEADAKKRVRNGEGPSIAWEVGHLLEHRYKMLESLGMSKENTFLSGHTREGNLAGDNALYIGEIRQRWNNLYIDLKATLETTTQETLERLVRGGVHGDERLIDSLLFLTWHEAYHMGALAAIRKQLGYPGPAEIAMANAAS